MLGVYSIGEQSRLDGAGLHQLCPVMLQQLDAGTCRTHKEEQGGDASPRPSDTEGQHGAPEVGQSVEQFVLTDVISDCVSCTQQVLFCLKVGMLLILQMESALNLAKCSTKEVQIAVVSH